MRKKKETKEEYIDKCCEGLVSYVCILSTYELSDKSKKVLSVLITESLHQWASEDEKLFREIEDFLSGEPDILEKTGFYKNLFSALLGRSEFLGRVSEYCDTKELERRMVKGRS